MARWKIRPVDPGEDGLIVTAPNGVEFESAHPIDVVRSVVRGLEETAVFAVGCDPILPPDWPALVLVPVQHGPCRRCSERKPADAFSLKPNGTLSGTCDHCCLYDSRRNGKALMCQICKRAKPDLRMRGGRVGCAECLHSAVEKPETRESFDVDKVCRDARASSGLPQSDAPRAMARNDISRSVVLDGGKMF